MNLYSTVNLTVATLPDRELHGLAHVWKRTGQTPQTDLFRQAVEKKITER